MPEMIDATVFELLLETGKSITSEVELEKLVQRITDIGTEISRAQFGAFFYNVVNANGEAYVLYTISGVPKEAFSKFPMPRNTEVFHPTFAGLRTVRYDDVTQEVHYGRMAPHFGMPRGHLPVKSYLAAPVLSQVGGDVIGGLFFGHSQPGIFTERSEKLIEGIAAQAAIAMTNAMLFAERKRAEEQVRDQREQYRSIFHSATDAIITIDEDGHVLEANTAATDMFECSQEELRKRRGTALFQPVDLFNAIESIVKSGRRYQGVAQVNCKSGPVDVRIVGTHYIHKGKTHVLLVIRQLDKAKAVEDALIKTKAFAETIASVSPVTLWMTNSQGEAIYINQAWMDVVGGRIEDHLGDGWLRRVVDEDRQRVTTAFVSSFAAKRVFSQDFRVQRRDGEIRWCTSYGTPYYLPDGSFGGFAGSLTDITDRKKIEQQVFSQNTLIQTITNNTLHALFLLDVNQRCTYMNPAAEQMTGYTLQEVQEKPLHYYVHHTHPDGRHFPIEECPIDRALPTRMQTRGEEVFIRKNGSFFPVAFVASPIIEKGQPIGTVIEVRDTTEEKRIQKELRNKERETMAILEQKVKERTAELEKINFELMQFTSVVSHDLKEPARKVSIFGQMVKDMSKDVTNPRFHKHIDSIIRSSTRMARLIDDLLAFSGITEKQLTFQPVDLNALIHQIKDDLQLAIEEKKATINTSGLPVVNGIELQLGQVFQNLVSNSLKFTAPKRPVVINIEASVENALHIIDYTDNGIGFENEMAERIFDIFERLHTKQEYEGTGIGLAIVKKIVELHGGTISASGAKDVGAHFRIMLPVASAPVMTNKITRP